jgi:hypothetical protein
MRQVVEVEEPVASSDSVEVSSERGTFQGDVLARMASNKRSSNGPRSKAVRLRWDCSRT